MKPLNYKDVCRQCPYLFEDNNKEWACDLDINLKCKNKFWDCID